MTLIEHDLPDRRDAADTGTAAYTRSAIAMDTFVTVHAETRQPASAVAVAFERALRWFAEVERTCSRFDPESELVRLCRRPGRPVAASTVLYEAVAFAREVAAVTGGAFDPTVGGAQRSRGFSRNYITGGSVTSAVSPAGYHDLRLDPACRTITLRRPLLLDLGAVAKGLAIDLAARELAGLERFAVEAGGDIFAGGAAPASIPWRIGVQHARSNSLLGTLTAYNRAVCTSGGYDRPAVEAGEHHLFDPRTGRSPRAVTGVTVVAPAAIVADALATAAFVLGPEAGRRLLEVQGVAGIIDAGEGTTPTILDPNGDLSWLPSTPDLG